MRPPKLCQVMSILNFLGAGKRTCNMNPRCDTANCITKTVKQIMWHQSNQNKKSPYQQTSHLHITPRPTKNPGRLIQRVRFGKLQLHRTRKDLTPNRKTLRVFRYEKVKVYSDSKSLEMACYPGWGVVPRNSNESILVKKFFNQKNGPWSSATPKATHSHTQNQQQKTLIIYNVQLLQQIWSSNSQPLHWNKWHSVRGSQNVSKKKRDSAFFTSVNHSLYWKMSKDW